MIQKKYNIDVSLILFFMFFIFMMRGLNSETYITLGLMITWLFVAFFSDTKSFINSLIDKSLIFVYIYITLLFVISMYHEGLITSIGYILGQLSIFIGILMFNFMKRKYSLNTLKKILIIVISIWIYYCLKALIFYKSNPLAARNIISNNEQYSDIAIGEGYGLAFGSALLFVYIISIIFKKQIPSRLNYLISIGIVTILLLLCIETGSTLTLIALIIGLFGSLFSALSGSSHKSNKVLLLRKVFWLTFFSFLSVFLFINIRNIGEWLMTIASNFNKLFASRIELIGIKLMYGESEGTLGAREYLYNKSIETFYDYPIFGTSIQHGLSDKTLLGGHSEFLDSFALLGIIGGISLSLIFLSSVYRERRSANNIISGSYILTLLVMFVFNPFHYPQSNFILFFVLPSLALVLRNYRIKTVGNN